MTFYRYLLRQLETSLVGKEKSERSSAAGSNASSRSVPLKIDGIKSTRCGQKDLYQIVYLSNVSRNPGPVFVTTHVRYCINFHFAAAGAEAITIGKASRRGATAEAIEGRRTTTEAAAATERSARSRSLQPLDAWADFISGYVRPSITPSLHLKGSTRSALHACVASCSSCKI